MSEYHFPRRDAQFVLNHVVDFSRICNSLKQDELDSGLIDAILDEAARFAHQVLAPLNQVGDQQGATITQSGVQETPGFKDAYQQFTEGGWSSLAGEPEFGGQGLPRTLSTVVMEIWQSANMSFSLCSLLTQGAIEAVTVHASDELKSIFLQKMVSGEWTATMNLTEPDAGSDLAAIQTKAMSEADHYRISGQKIFITWGDHQMTDNIVHLVLARLPDAPEGVRGISLFIVPKFIVNTDGSPGRRNDAKAVSIEHKLGIHGSPTCTMSYGEHEGAIGYLVGEPHTGLACMFTMMNDARQGVGLQGVAISERAYQHALSYAKERIQGVMRDGSRVAIVHHPDVRRMLMLMKSGTEAMRALAYVAASESDKLTAASERNKPLHQARLDLYTPVVKGWMTELAQELTSLGVQIQGGMGYIEETGAAQFFRDARILPIYEGTTGIQGLDLVGRKILMNKGESVNALLNEIADEFKTLRVSEELASVLKTAIDTEQQVRDGVDWLLNHKDEASAVGVNLMMSLGYLCGAWLMLRSAAKALALSVDESEDHEFLTAKQVSARFYGEHFLPRVAMHLQTMKTGSAAIMALDVEQF
ncbi:acyl-CoA dehydrogenase [Neptunomonas qingdaonensis]|uniref:3-methylmercaptopropionyl-CoA dehydrogenase n=1 Tax=Neptunomonas qingdaonensis TaxID=1045558 RepID=A0A1I2WH18_9GAMM|nr:acyl-CoA dehydrogenase [Neptunomonas qingdaonensis]SFH00623.1 Acyl-CoA dehydrogenase [Neptunomonas qingdaonensis]